MKKNTYTISLNFGQITQEVFKDMIFLTHFIKTPQPRWFRAKYSYKCLIDFHFRFYFILLLSKYLLLLFYIFRIFFSYTFKYLFSVNIERKKMKILFSRKL